MAARCDRHDAPDWLTSVRRYLLVSVVGDLLWETAQLPLYTLWRTGTPVEVTKAVVHCTIGDVLIAAASLLAALVLVGLPGWPSQRRLGVGGCTMLFGLGYTIYSEYLNTVVRSAWTYTDSMPVLPLIGTGLAPLGQWVVVPAVALLLACRSRGRPCDGAGNLR